VEGFTNAWLLAANYGASTSAGSILGFQDTTSSAYDEKPRFPFLHSSRMLKLPFKSQNNPLKTKNQVKVFPNPAKDILNIKYSVQNADNVYIRVVDLLGREIVTLKDTGGENTEQIKTNTWDVGTYIYEVRANAERIGSGVFMISR
jgi:hypothetical protein